MNNIELIPIILMHSIPLPGLEEQIISIYKELSISTVKYSIESADGYIILGLDYTYKNKHENNISLKNKTQLKNNDTIFIIGSENSTSHNIEYSEVHKDTKAGVICKIINKFEEIKDNKNYIKILLSIKSRIILNAIETINYEDKEILLASINENSFDDIKHTTIKSNKFNCYQTQYQNKENNDDKILQKEVTLLIQKFKNYSHTYGSIQTYNFISEISDISKKVDRLAYEFQLSQQELFDLIIDFNLQQRILLVSRIIDKAILKQQLNKAIDEQVKEQIEKTQKIYLLTEKAKIINKEIEVLTGESSDTEILEKKLDEINVDQEIKNKLQSEIRRLKSMHNNSSDAGVVRNYLDWCLNMPWNIYSAFKKNFCDVYDVLNKEHYGMEKVKERILEYLAVEFRDGATAKSALLLVGPPGVGKTSLSKKIATALGRSFARISLGGIRDEADIRGHRRTYLGSMPGKIMRSIRDSKTMNPVILLDEIDKIGNDFRGDPAAALLEVLDKEQNKDFLDHYLDIPFNLSNILFICTANSLNNISRPLLDRVEIIELASYSDDEKFKIATKYMIPKQKTEHGLKNSEIIFDEDSVQTIISRYTYEAGVRNLEEQISMIMRKSLLKIINENEQTPINIKSDVLEEFLGLPKFLREQNRVPMIGIIQGLAWNQLGGDVLTIECLATPNETPNYNGSIKYTGKLGEVMQESIQTAFSYLKSCKNIIKIDESSYKTHDIHVHVPDGGTPKDGPSAGVTIFTALASLLMKKKIRTNIAMTGEITLRGRVTAIGGLKEKILAAKRNKIKTILIPKENERELIDIPSELKIGLEIIMIENAIDSLQYAIIEDDIDDIRTQHFVQKIRKKKSIKKYEF
jgi:ATP-dependent Lon protease